MKLSIGVLESALRLLDIVHRHETVSAAIKDELPRVLVVQTETVLDLAVRCGWLASDGHGGLRLSNAGEQILLSGSVALGLRRQVADFIRAIRPAWFSQISKGRTETVAVVAADTRYVLREAGLLVEPATDDVIEWWDTLAGEARAERSGILGLIGRRGERLSLAYEEARTGYRPDWISVETNLAGYDLLSRADADSSAALPIEVKSSTAAMASAAFHVSANEWKVACSQKHHVFHLWRLETPPKLAVITPAQLEPHVPIEQNSGRWESFFVPMKAFEPEFKDVHIEVQ